MENNPEIEKKKRKYLLPFLLAVGVVLLGFVAYVLFRPVISPKTSAVAPALPPPQDEPPALGPPHALVTIEEFSDFQCPYCAKSVPVLKEILQAFPNDVRLVFRHFPVAQSHPQAPLVHMAVLAAGRQKRFWEMHDIVFENREHVADEDLLAYAQQLGLDMGAFRRSFRDLSMISRIKADFDEGVRRGVRATPTFFVNGRKLEGALTFPEFKKEIERAIAEARQGTQGKPAAAQ